MNWEARECELRCPDSVASVIERELILYDIIMILNDMILYDTKQITEKT